MKYRHFFPLLVLAASASLFAQEKFKPQPDDRGPNSFVFPKDVPIPPAPVLTPEEQAKSFVLPPGFRAELVLADPNIGEPVQIQFDEKGRLWVVEMRGYMADTYGKGEDEANGRISVHEDTNGDGKMDKSTVFLDKLVMPRAIMLRKGGAVICEPPNVYWCADANGDLIADGKELLIEKYTGAGNPEHISNGLLWALDNWIYNAKSDKRYRILQSGEVKTETTQFRGQWGIAQDDLGRLYYNSNSDQLRACLVPTEYLARNTNFREAFGANVQIAKDQKVYPIRVNPGVNRGYMKGTLKPDGKLASFTAASAPTVFRGTALPPEYHGNAFVPEPAGNLIKRDLLTEKDGVLNAAQAWPDKEFMASTDERFRPVTLTNGPDGALYIVDMYRGVIQHITYVTPYLREQLLSRGLDAPRHQGRVWRIVADGGKKTPLPKFDRKDTAGLITALDSPNGWTRDTAQRLLIEANAPAAATALAKAATTASTPLGRLHALWTLEGMERAELTTIATAALGDADPRVRAAAVRLAGRAAAKDPAVAAKVLALAKDKDSTVRLQVLFTAGDIATPAAHQTIISLLAAHHALPLFRSAALSGLQGQELATLKELTALPAWAAAPEKADAKKDKKETGEDPRFATLQMLARCLFNTKKADTLTAALDIAATAQPWQAEAILRGIALNKGDKPVKLTAEPPALAKIAALPGLKNASEKTLAALTWPGKAGAAPEVKLPPLTDAEKTFIAAGKQTYTVLCGTCHQPHGNGQDGLAPALAFSDWVTGSEQRLIRIVIGGVGGPIEVNGKKWSLDMPPLGAALNDEQIAQILSYIRREWGNEAPLVKTETVAAVRQATKERTASWTAAELLKIE